MSESNGARTRLSPLTVQYLVSFVLLCFAAFSAFAAPPAGAVLGDKAFDTCSDSSNAN